MEGSAGAPPQRVCPKCARISWATGPRCPYCSGRFRRQTGVTPWMLALTALVVLAGVLVMLIVAGDMLDQRLDDRVADVQKQFDTSLGQMREDVRKELDARLPATGAVTPVPTATVTPEGEGTQTPTPTPTASPTTTPGATATPTATTLRP
jgi:hypothetical protein